MSPAWLPAKDPCPSPPAHSWYTFLDRLLFGQPVLTRPSERSPWPQMESLPKFLLSASSPSSSPYLFAQLPSAQSSNSISPTCLSRRLFTCAGNREYDKMGSYINHPHRQTGKSTQFDDYFAGPHDSASFQKIIPKSGHCVSKHPFSPKSPNTATGKGGGGITMRASLSVVSTEGAEAGDQRRPGRVALRARHPPCKTQGRSRATGSTTSKKITRPH